MFQRILPHSNAEQLFRLWQDSYIIEKQIIEASIFPPLNRKVNDFLNSENEFFFVVNVNTHLRQQTLIMFIFFLHSL